MADYESRDLATAARRAQEEMAGEDDRPSPAEVAEVDPAAVTDLVRQMIQAAARMARREAITGVVEALRERGYHTAAAYIVERFMWTPTENSEEAGW